MRSDPAGRRIMMRAFATPVTRFFGRSTNRPEACRAAHHFAKTRTPPECVSLRSCHGGGVPGTLRRVHRNYFVMRAPLVKRVGAIEVPPGTRARRTTSLFAPQ